jgi:hypothetical protein
MGGSGIDLSMGNPQDTEVALPMIPLADRPPRKASLK